MREKGRGEETREGERRGEERVKILVTLNHKINVKNMYLYKTVARRAFTVTLSFSLSLPLSLSLSLSP